MPKTTWLSGADLKIKKKRKNQREYMDRQREQNRIATSQNRKRPGKDSTWSEGRCRECSALIWFDTRDGKLIPMDPGTRKPHEHENG